MKPSNEHTHHPAFLKLSHPVIRRHRRASALCLCLALALAAYNYLSSPPPVEALSSTLVISQVYGAGGNAGATYNQDFIEIYNRGAAAVSLNGYSIQYAGDTNVGNFASVLALNNFSLQPGQYYLIATGTASGTNGAPLPTPDQTGTFAMGATAGKVALVNGTSAVSSTCTAGQPNGSGIVDFVGYGTTANCSETSPAPAPSATTADIRKGGGTVETDNNSLDFTAAAPTPRNTSGSTITLDSTAQACWVPPDGGDDANPLTLRWQHTIGKGTTRALFVAVSTLGGTGPNVTSVTYNSVTMTRIDDGTANTFLTFPQSGDARTVEMFVLKNANLPAAGTTAFVTVTLSASAQYAVGGSISFNGVNQTTANRGFASNTNSSGNPTVTVASATGDVVLDTVANGFVSANSLTPDASQTERWDGVACNGPPPSDEPDLQSAGISLGAGSTEAGATSTVMSWTQSVTAPWAIGAVSIVPLAPTQVKLASFTATQSDAGVNLNWETGSEVDNLGFNVYREAGGKHVRLNPSLIAGSALIAATPLTSGFSYSWLDARGTNDSVYWLEDIDLDGTRTWHGPIMALAASSASVTSQKRQQQAPLLSQLSKTTSSSTSRAVQQGQPAALSATTVNAATTASTTTTPPLPSSTLAGRAGIKLSVRQSGWYRVTQPELAAAGLSTLALARNMRLFADGVEQHIKVYSKSGRMDAGSYIEFYGMGLDIPSTDTRIYWLIAATTPGKRISTLGDPRIAPPPAPKLSLVAQPAQPTQTQKAVASAPQNQTNLATALPQSFAYTAERRERMLYVSSIRNGDAENFFGAIVSTTPVDQVINVHHLDRASSEQPVLEVVLQGVNFQEHEVKVLLNGVEVGTARYADQANSSTRFTVSQSLLNEGDNTVKLIAQKGDTDASLVDALKLTYAHLYRADSDRLHFRADSLKTIRADGFTRADVRVMDITDPNHLQEIIPQVKAQGTGYAITFETGASLSKTPRTFLAFTDNQYERSTEIKANQPTAWSRSGPTAAADFVIITHGQFRQMVEPLARLRRNQGKLVRVIDVEDLYDEFSHGAHNPQAIKDFLAWTQSHWGLAPRFALLVGDGSYDPRNYQGRGQYDLFPTRMVDTKYMQTADDDWFADFNNDGIAEMAIGRLPARTAPEAWTMVKKIINYSNNSGRGVLLISDRVGPDGFSFEEVNDQLKPFVPDTVGVQKIVRGPEDADTMRALIIDGLNRGQIIANYAGHGAYERWTGDGILRATDAGALANNGKPTLFVTMTCMNGYYHNLTADSLAEAMIKVENGGAVAVWASSGITVPTTQSEINQKLYQQLFSSPALTLGEAVQRAKAATSDLDVRRTWILFGDPTMLIR